MRGEKAKKSEKITRVPLSSFKRKIFKIFAFSFFSILTLAVAFTVFSVGKIKEVKEKEFDFWKAVFSEIPTPEKPPQPIRFSHKVHAGQLGIECQHCHFYADRSKYAGIPPLSVCTGCHNPRMKALPLNQKPEVQKIFKYWEEGKPIPWRKVHDLPDFVRFTHKRHVKAGVDCTECHGPVAEMTTAQRVAPLTMGWCLQCHRQRGASTECHICHY